MWVASVSTLSTLLAFPGACTLAEGSVPILQTGTLSLGAGRQSPAPHHSGLSRGQVATPHA